MFLLVYVIVYLFCFALTLFIGKIAHVLNVISKKDGYKVISERVMENDTYESISPYVSIGDNEWEIYSKIKSINMCYDPMQCAFGYKLSRPNMKIKHQLCILN